MKAWVYYVLAAVLVAVTLPMYRYLLRSDSAIATPVAVVEPVRSVPVRVTRVPLLRGEICAGGVVVMVAGSSYTSVSDASGPVRCSGRYAFRR